MSWSWTPDLAFAQRHRPERGSGESPDRRRRPGEHALVDLQQTYVKLERELAQERTKLIQDLLNQAKPRVEKIARAQGVAVILDQNAVVWSDPAVNLTPMLNAEMQ